MHPKWRSGGDSWDPQETRNSLCERHVEGLNCTQIPQSSSVLTILPMKEMYAKRLGILENPRVLNVAITRAKYGLICVGNADVLSKGSKDFRDFIHSLRSCKCILSQNEFLASVRAYRASQ